MLIGLGVLSNAGTRVPWYVVRFKGEIGHDHGVARLARPVRSYEKSDTLFSPPDGPAGEAQLIPTAAVGQRQIPIYIYGFSGNDRQGRARYQERRRLVQLYPRRRKARSAATFAVGRLSSFPAKRPNHLPHPHNVLIDTNRGLMDISFVPFEPPAPARGVRAPPITTGWWRGSPSTLRA